jgi:hypothetical protein
MLSAAELRRIAAFSDLPDNQIDWFLSHAEEMVLHADPPAWMFVFLEGAFQWRGEFGGDTVVMPANAGEISGVYPFSRMKKFTVGGRALSDGRLLRFPVSLFPELVQKMPELTTSLVAMMSERVREGTRIEQQHDRLSRSVSWRAAWPTSSTIQRRRRSVRPASWRQRWRNSGIRASSWGAEISAMRNKQRSGRSRQRLRKPIFLHLILFRFLTWKIG